MFFDRELESRGIEGVLEGDLFLVDEFYRLGFCYFCCLDVGVFVSSLKCIFDCFFDVIQDVWIAVDFWADRGYEVVDVGCHTLLFSYRGWKGL